MRNTQVSGRIASVLSLIALLLGGASMASAQDLSVIQKPGDKGDYPVHVGKRVRWASEVYKERMAAVQQAAEAVGRIQPTTLMPVLVGKQSLPAPTSTVSQLAARQSETSVAASSEQEERPRAKGYFEKRGRATFWVELPKH